MRAAYLCTRWTRACACAFLAPMLSSAIVDGATFPAHIMDWGFGQAQELYVINDLRLDRDGGIVYEVSVWPDDGRPGFALSEVSPGCKLEDRTAFHASGDTVYMTTKCYFTERGKIWVSIGGSAFREVEEFEDAEDYQHWLIEAGGHLLRFHASIHDVYSWQRSRYSPNGLESRIDLEFSPDTAFVNRFSGPMTSNLSILPNGHWFFLIQSSIPGGNLDVRDRSRVEINELASRPLDWFVYWTLDPESLAMPLWGVGELENMSHGRVRGWLGKRGVEPVLNDSDGVAYLVQGGSQFPRRPTPESVQDINLYLLRFDDHGAPIAPGPDRGNATLRRVEELAGPPVRRVVRKVPAGLLSGRRHGTYMILELDAYGGIVIRDHQPAQE